jgi:hypothetical protein
VVHQHGDILLGGMSGAQFRADAGVTEIAGRRAARLAWAQGTPRMVGGSSRDAAATSD